MNEIIKKIENRLAFTKDAYKRHNKIAEKEMNKPGNKFDVENYNIHASWAGAYELEIKFLENLLVMWENTPPWE